MKSAYLKVVTRKDYTKKDGTNPVCLRISIDGKIKYFAVAHVRPESWDEKRSRVKRSDSSHTYKNKEIDSAFLKAKGILHDFKVKGDTPTFREFSELYTNDKQRGLFIPFAQKELDAKRAVYAAESMRTHQTPINKLKVYNPELTFKEINLQWIKDYENYLRTELNNRNNTVHKSLSFIRMMLNEAKRQGIITENPFDNYKIKKEPGKRAFLTLDEINRIENLYNGNTLTDGQRKAARSFLFACYTGLRYGDIKALTHRQIQQVEDSFVIDLTMHKTDLQVRIPIPKKALQWVDFADALPNQKAIPTYCNQVQNRRLKELAELAEIDKTVSFHVARHSFATNAISIGIPLDVVSKILGHTNVKTTQIYTKYSDKLKIDYMKRFDRL
jgi:site-specific recombinase XerD